MSIFSRHNRRHLVPLHCDNARSKDWVILLEANTTVGPSQESFRVARATQERWIVRRLRSLRRRLFLLVEGYDPHVLFFCQQLYKYGVVPMPGDEIGNCIAQAIADEASRRRSWYGPVDAIPNKPLIEAAMLDEFDTLVVEAPALVLPAPLKAGMPERETEKTVGS